ncbi:MAG: hypothetical protein AB1610_08585 [Nitrospirota bacterium]
MKNLGRFILIVFLVVSAFGCASKYMKPAGLESTATYKPNAEE